MAAQPLSFSRVRYCCELSYIWLVPTVILSFLHSLFNRSELVTFATCHPDFLSFRATLFDYITNCASLTCYVSLMQVISDIYPRVIVSM